MAKPLYDVPPVDLHQAVFVAMGAASICWDRINDAGTFQSERAEQYGQALVAWINENYIPKTTDKLHCPACGVHDSVPLHYTYDPEAKDYWRCRNCGHHFQAKEHA